jgi:hypothetical protein
MILWARARARVKMLALHVFVYKHVTLALSSLFGGS